MRFSPYLSAALVFWAACTSSPVLRAAETLPVQEVPNQSVSFIDRTVDQVEATLDKALDLIGIRYRRGGSSPDSGFDCSGFVNHVFKEGLGLYLPRSAKEMSRTGDEVGKEELKPGDLVFFNTMRRTFSHVGIYLGDNLFVHSPRVGGKVRIEDLRDRYWTRRYNGARRVAD